MLSFSPYRYHHEAQHICLVKLKESKRQRNAELPGTLFNVPCPLGACGVVCSASTALSDRGSALGTCISSCPIPTLPWWPSTCQAGGSGGSSRNPLLSDWQLFALLTVAPAERRKEAKVSTVRTGRHSGAQSPRVPDVP